MGTDFDKPGLGSHLEAGRDNVRPTGGVNCRQTAKTLRPKVVQLALRKHAHSVIAPIPRATASLPGARVPFRRL